MAKPNGYTIRYNEKKPNGEDIYVGFYCSNGRPVVKAFECSEPVDLGDGEVNELIELLLDFDRPCEAMELVAKKLIEKISEGG